MLNLSKKSTAALQYMSDVHLERCKYDFSISQAAPILVLAGDIGRFCDQDLYRAFLAQQCAQFDMVLLVAGNHEFYGCSRDEGLAIAQSFVDDVAMAGKLHFLNRTIIDLPQSDTTILGCTLQSHIAPDCAKLTNDFQRIKDWHIRDHNEEHQRDLAWLRSATADVARAFPARNIVVVTHYAPSFERTCHPLQTNNAVSQCFCSHTLQETLTWTGAQSLGHWIFGHTHWNAKFKFNKITVLSNQYCSESSNLTWLQKHTLHRPFDPKATIHV